MSKQLIFIAKADTNRFSDRLSEERGKQQISRTAATLEAYLENKKFVIFSSSAPHTIESTKIFNNHFENSGKIRTFHYGLVAEDMKTTGRELYRRIQNLDPAIDCAILWSNKEIMNKQIELFGWNKLNTNPDQASGYIVAVDKWSDISLTKMKVTPPEQVANFTCGEPLKPVTTPKIKQLNTLKAG